MSLRIEGDPLSLLGSQRSDTLATAYGCHRQHVLSIVRQRGDETWG